MNQCEQPVLNSSASSLSPVDQRLNFKDTSPCPSSPVRHTKYLIAVYASGCSELFINKAGQHHPVLEFVDYREKYSSLLGKPIYEVDYIFFNVSPCLDCANRLMDHFQAYMQKPLCIFIAHLYEKDPTGVDMLLRGGISVNVWDWNVLEQQGLRERNLELIDKRSSKKCDQETLNYISGVKRRLLHSGVCKT